MRSNTDPELHRIPLEEVCLAILASNLTADCRDFMSRSIEPPPQNAMDAAMESLSHIGAITTSDGPARLTPLGKHLAQLPVDARLGKMLIYGAIFGCLDPILTVVSALSAAKSPFLSSFDNASESKAAHNSFFDAESDFISFVNVFNAFDEALANGKGRSFCREKFLNYTTLQEMKETRIQLADLLRSLGFLQCDMPVKANEGIISKCKESRYKSRLALVNNVICAGLFPNVGKVEGKPGDNAIVVHKSERLHVNSPQHKKIQTYQKSEWIAFFEKFGTERRTMVSCTAFINPLSLLLFGNNLVVHHRNRQATIDGWMELRVAAKTALTFRCLKENLSEFLQKAVDMGKIKPNAESAQLIDLLASLLST